MLNFPIFAIVRSGGVSGSQQQRQRQRQRLIAAPQTGPRPESQTGRLPSIRSSSSRRQSRKSYALPFAFCDRPPGLNRFLGIQWLANLFYPDYYDVDMVDVVREFYSRCYWQNLTVEQANRILEAR